MKRLLSSFLSPFSRWLAFQTVLVLHQSSMLVCIPSQPCRWWPVQPVKKQPWCLCVCVFVCVGVFVRVPLCGKEYSKGIWPLYKAPGKSTGQHCLQTLHNHKFLSICGPLLWSTERVASQWLDSHSASWKSTKSLFKFLPAGPSKLCLSASQCARHIKRSNSDTVFCSSCMSV